MAAAARNPGGWASDMVELSNSLEVTVGSKLIGGEDCFELDEGHSIEVSRVRGELKMAI